MTAPDSSRELRTRLEALQADIKAATEALAAPDPEGFVAELAALRESTQAAEGEASGAELEATNARQHSLTLREDVERAEQSVLAPRAVESVPVVSIFMVVLAFVVGLWACIAVLQLPRTPALELAVRVVAGGAFLPVAWVAKRRLMRPRTAPRITG